MMTPSQAVRYLRERAQYADLVRDAYLGADVLDAAQRFSRSAEFEEIARFIGNRLQNAVVLDLGAGAGAASYAFATRGARIVYAVEPDLSKDVGGLAIREIAFNLPVQIVSAIGEALPFPDQTIDVVFGRQVLHHTRDLNLNLIGDCARIACRWCHGGSARARGGQRSPIAGLFESPSHPCTGRRRKRISAQDIPIRLYWRRIQTADNARPVRKRYQRLS